MKWMFGKRERVSAGGVYLPDPKGCPRAGVLRPVVRVDMHGHELLAIVQRLFFPLLIVSQLTACACPASRVLAIAETPERVRLYELNEWWGAH